MTPRSRRRPEKVDFKRTQPELYRASRDAGRIRAGRGTFLASDGVGEPGGSAFQEAIGRIFALAYTAKFALKAAGTVDFAVPALECLWFDDPREKPRNEWRWRLLVRIPDQISARDLQPIRKSLVEKKHLDTSSIRRITWTEGLALQMLHVGPYDTIGAAYEKLMASAREQGLECAGAGHEIYVSDPRRVAPARIKTIVRMGMRRAPKH